MQKQENYVVFIGHSTVYFQLDGAGFLADPLFTKTAKTAANMKIDPAERYPVLAKLPRPKYVLVSHRHYDHFDPRILSTINPGTVITGKGFRKFIKPYFSGEVAELAPWESFKDNSFEITAVPQRHVFSGILPILPCPTNGYIIKGAATVYFMGDTLMSKVFDEIAKKHSIDLLMIPVSGRELIKLFKGHIYHNEAVKIVKILKPRIVIPIHWGYARGIPLILDIKGNPEKFVQLANKECPGTKAYFLNSGEKAYY